MHLKYRDLVLTTLAKKEIDQNSYHHNPLKIGVTVSIALYIESNWHYFKSQLCSYCFENKDLVQIAKLFVFQFLYLQNVVVVTANSKVTSTK